ncbi:MAG: DUF308 domain-containing protein [Acidobacteriia bacterium]|nr:DUF308 domain-containing protein [Terriglobia bacterium]
MIRILIRNWWLLALRGGFAMLFGLIAFSMRYEIESWVLGAVALNSLLVMFALLAFVSGAFTVAAALWGAARLSHWWWLLVDGLVACTAGVLVLVLPDITLTELTHIIALSALIMSAVELGAAAKIRRHIADERFLAAAAAGSFVFGMYLTFHGVSDVRSALIWLGFYSLFSGIMMTALALRLRSLRHEHPHLAEEAISK